MPLQNHYFRVIKTVALLLAAMTPVYIRLLQLSGSIGDELLPFVMWIISPYIFLFIATALLERFSGIKKIFVINCAVAVLILAFTIGAYSIALDETSDTAHLIFFFGPIWVSVVSFFSLGFTLLFLKLAGKGT